MTDHFDDTRPLDHTHHDVELVAAYASGAVDDVVDERRAAEWLERCPVCQEEFELQNGVERMLAGIERPAMTDEERRRLHAGVAADLDSADIGATVIDLKSRRQQRWLTTASVAAVSLAAVIGVVGLLSNGGTDDAGMASGDESVAATEVPTQQRELEPGAAADFATEETAAMAAAEEMAEEAEDEAVAGSLAAEDTDAAEDQAPPIREDLSDPQTRESLLAYIDERIADVAERTPFQPVSPSAFSDAESPAPQCLTDDIEDLHLVIDTNLDGEDVEVFIVGASPEELMPLTFRASNCDPLVLDP